MAAVIDLSDDDVVTVSQTPARSSANSTILDLDAQLARSLQREEELIEGRKAQIPQATAAQHLNSDAALALKLQREEEERAALVTASFSAPLASPCRKRPLEANIGGNVDLLPETETVGHLQRAPEVAPLSSDAVALLKDCIRSAKDADRSEFYLCGSTPFFHQHKRRYNAGNHQTGSFGEGNQGQPTDNWSCGYRNTQMLIGHLLQRSDISGSVPQPLFGGSVPDIRSLQAELESLWSKGYDPEGRQQLGGIVGGTQKWIGTSEACVLLRGQSIRCNIVAFRGSQKDDPSDTAVSAAGALMERALRHFRAGTAASSNGSTAIGKLIESPCPPLYLQHDGHSRTIVGVQRRHEKNGQLTDFLLVLDPGLGQKGFDDFSACARRGQGWERFVKRSLTPLNKKPEYELLAVETDGVIRHDMAAAARNVARRV
eukprot:TRINITY_DN37951_c0_g1_i1.p1 TRINITY_DN37951_c0_g1~~TRINITY_DN37951_c0_g1_i1.p1  ORF type:complete len:442 (+),score=87.14 TRINITY_DN37951_c0_g1_i1:39-1328(+)